MEEKNDLKPESMQEGFSEEGEEGEGFDENMEESENEGTEKEEDF